MNMLLQIPPHLKCVTTLPCEMYDVRIQAGDATNRLRGQR